MTIPPPPPPQFPPSLPATPPVKPIKTEKLSPGGIVAICFFGPIILFFILAMILGNSPQGRSEATSWAATSKSLTETIQPSKTFIPTKTTKPTKTPLPNSTPLPTNTPLPTSTPNPTKVNTPTMNITEPMNTVASLSPCVGLENTDADPYGIYIYTTSDDLLAIRGKADSVNQVGTDMMGLIVNWVYPDRTYTLKRREDNGITAYRVVEICENK